MFIFYDTETSGLNGDFSQILQIALVFTDGDLNILSSKKLECRRSPWVVPEPGALLTTGFVPDDLKNNKYSNYEMMKQIDQWVRGQHWPVIFAGYNNIGFDDPLLAQSLHQNLLDPNLTAAVQDGQSNGSIDVMVLVKATAAYMPGALKLDLLNDKQHVSMTLMNVAAQNGVNLTADDAHDAMNDIKATVGVAKVIQKAAPFVWEQMLKLSTAQGVTDFLAQNKVFTYTVSNYGNAKTTVATSVVTRAGSDTEVLFNLALDPTPYLNMTVPELRAALEKEKFVKGQPEKPQPFCLMRKGVQPILMDIEQSQAVLTPEYDAALYAARADLIKSNPQFQQNLSAAAVIQKQEKTAPLGNEPELQIENPVRADLKPQLEQWRNDFLNARDWKAAAFLVNNFYNTFGEEAKNDASLRRYVNFAGRIVFEHAPETLSAEQQAAMKKYIANRILNIDPKAPYMTVLRAKADLDKIEKERNEGKPHWKNVTDGQIRSLKLYYTSLEKEYAPFYTGPAAPAPVQPANDVAPPKPPEANKPAA